MTIDACIHPLCAHKKELLDYISEPWRGRPLSEPSRYFYPAPGGEYRIEGEEAAGSIASDPERLAERIFSQPGTKEAILVPLTRGLLPDLDHSMAVCRGANDWLADRWLTAKYQGKNFRGSIRIDPREPAQAIAEIERWANDKRMVQIAVPMQAGKPYGNRDYLPVWEAAAKHSLPVMIHADGGASIDFWPSPAGYYQLFMEYATLYPINFSYHLASLIAEGVFDRFKNFKVIFGDGGHDQLAPIIWRLDKDWRPTRSQMPWNEHLPSEYLADHVRFISSGYDGPQTSEDWQTWSKISHPDKTLLFGSRYPTWEYQGADKAFKSADENLRNILLHQNASEFYGFDNAKSN